MGATHTAERIQKLLAKGLSPESIARKIGRPGPDGVARVEAEKAKLEPKAEETTTGPATAPAAPGATAAGAWRWPTMTIEALQQDVSVRTTGTLIGDQDRLLRRIEKDRALLTRLSERNGAVHARSSMADAEMELDLVRAELRMR